MLHSLRNIRLSALVSCPCHSFQPSSEVGLRYHPASSTWAVSSMLSTCTLYYEYRATQGLVFKTTNVILGEDVQDALLSSSKDVSKIVPEAKVVYIVHFTKVPDLHPAVLIINKVGGY